MKAKSVIPIVAADAVADTCLGGATELKQSTPVIHLLVRHADHDTCIAPVVKRVVTQL